MLNNMRIASNDAAAAGFGVQLKTIENENKFFDALSSVNAALVRDYLVKNLQSLTDYTELLGKGWEAIVNGQDGLHADEHKIYEEFDELVKKIVKDMAEQEKTFREKAGKFAGWVAGMVANGGRTSLSLFSNMLSAKILVGRVKRSGRGRSG